VRTSEEVGDLAHGEVDFVEPQPNPFHRCMKDVLGGGGRPSDEERGPDESGALVSVELFPFSFRRSTDRSHRFRTSPSLGSSQILHRGD